MRPATESEEIEFRTDRNDEPFHMGSTIYQAFAAKRCVNSWVTVQTDVQRSNVARWRKFKENNEDLY